MVTKVEPPIDQHILKELHRRIDMLETTDLGLGKRELDLEKNLNNLKSTIVQEINHFHNEVNTLLKEVSSLKKFMFHVGHDLREKVPKQELEQLQEQINKWELEAFATRKELNRLYSLYAPTK